MKFLLIGGARPNYVKIAPIWKAYQKYRKKQPKRKLLCKLVNTGQHYDYLMSKKFFRDLGIPAPHINLGVGSGSHAEQTARILVSFEKVLLKEKPDLIIVVGDVNSTLGCSLVAAKLGVKIAHVEAGLRSFDREMPEEINRLMTDAISDELFVTCKDAITNLTKEGIARKKIHFVGNVMVDSLLANLKKASKINMKKKLGLEKDYAVLTLHRPSNVDRFEDLMQIMKAIESIQKKIQVVFPVHPRTETLLKKDKRCRPFILLPNLKLAPPLGYLEFMSLLKNATLVLSDSGGIQEETTVLGVPCLTLRKNTERPVTIGEGTNFLVGTKRSAIERQAFQVLKQMKKKKKKRVPKYWDGKAAERIISILAKQK